MVALCYIIKSMKKVKFSNDIWKVVVRMLDQPPLFIQNLARSALRKWLDRAFVSSDQARLLEKTIQKVFVTIFLASNSVRLQKLTTKTKTNEQVGQRMSYRCWHPKFRDQQKTSLLDASSVVV